MSNPPDQQAIQASDVASARSDNRDARFIVSARGNRTHKPIAGPTALSKLHLRLIELMTHGLDRELPHFPHIKAHAPLPLETAAALCRMRLRQARSLATYPIFQAELAKQIQLMRTGAKAKAMQVTIDALSRKPVKAADQKVALEAADRILGDDIGAPRSNSSPVTVNVNVEPGYIIRLPARPAADAKTIDHEPGK